MNTVSLDSRGVVRNEYSVDALCYRSIKLLVTKADNKIDFSTQPKSGTGYWHPATDRTGIWMGVDNDGRLVIEGDVTITSGEETSSSRTVLFQRYSADHGYWTDNIGHLSLNSQQVLELLVDGNLKAPSMGWAMVPCTIALK